MNLDRFKIRVWDKLEKKMYYPFNTYTIEDNVAQGSLITLNQRKGLSGKEERFFHTDRCELMQCTGLKDFNNKLIYENDIVKTVNYDPDETGLIVWSDAKYEWFITDGIDDQMGELANDLEIIGNKYENPELIK